MPVFSPKTFNTETIVITIKSNLFQYKNSKLVTGKICLEIVFPTFVTFQTLYF